MMIGISIAITNGGIMGRDLENPPIWSGAKDAANAWQTENKK